MILWAAVQVLAYVDRSYSVPAEIGPAMLVAVGYFLGSEVIKIGRRSDD